MTLSHWAQRLSTILVTLLLSTGCAPDLVGQGRSEPPPDDNPIRVPTVANGKTDHGHPTVGHLSIGCTGTLIGSRTVLTAAHCGWHSGNPNHSVTFGNKTYPTHDLIRHTQYNDNSNDLAYDVAIVHLKTPVTSIAPSGILKSQPFVNEPIQIVGFGETGVGRHDIQKRMAKNAIGEIRQLVFVFKHTPADGPQWGNVCHGDSGGPVFDQAGTVIGVHAMWDFKTQADLQGDYCWKIKGGATRVDKFHNWILGYLDKQIGVGAGNGTHAPNNSAGGGGAIATCAGQCGSPQKVAGSCYCDTACLTNGDCCADYNAHCSSGGGSGGSGGGGGGGTNGSCTGHCNRTDKVPGGNCYCDAYCVTNGDCCANYTQVCGAGGGNGSGNNNSNGGTTESCVGYCGNSLKVPSGNCYCDSFCDTNGDCCPDYHPVCGSSSAGGGGGGGGGSCVGLCGSTGKAPGGTCYCDSSCGSNGDCCSDYDMLCKGSGGGGGGNTASCFGHCGNDQKIDGKCYCDAFCEVSGDCCSDYALLCGG